MALYLPRLHQYEKDTGGRPAHSNSQGMYYILTNNQPVLDIKLKIRLLPITKKKW